MNFLTDSDYFILFHITSDYYFRLLWSTHVVWGQRLPRVLTSVSAVSWVDLNDMPRPANSGTGKTGR